MLLFIEKSSGEIDSSINFKTSHVIVYLFPIVPLQFWFGISKHLMLLFIIADMFHEYKIHISKHLMLLFITIARAEYISRNCISKHLMLLFISQLRLSKSIFCRFQNISCYCLSSLRCHISDGLPHFKTSHVIVYLAYCDICGEPL